MNTIIINFFLSYSVEISWLVLIILTSNGIVYVTDRKVRWTMGGGGLLLNEQMLLFLNCELFPLKLREEHNDTYIWLAECQALKTSIGGTTRIKWMGRENGADDDGHFQRWIQYYCLNIRKWRVPLLYSCWIFLLIIDVLYFEEFLFNRHSFFVDFIMREFYSVQYFTKFRKKNLTRIHLKWVFHFKWFKWRKEDESTKKLLLVASPCLIINQRYSFSEKILKRYRHESHYHRLVILSLIMTYSY